MTLVPITYKGGVYKHDIVTDLIDDLGGYIIQRHVIASDVIVQALVPQEDIELIRKIARPLAGEVIESPLVGTEIAVVSPSLEIHHLPHSSCDIAEYLRRAGAKTNMVGLARGFGKRIANLSIEERNVINEHDCAVYLLGSFESCIEHKFPTLRRGITVPIILSGGPDKAALQKIIDPPVEGYVGNIGRVGHRLRKENEIDKLDELVDEISQVLTEVRQDIAKDPLSVSPARLMKVLDDTWGITEGSTHPTPITVQIDGLRVKLPYEEFAEQIGATAIEEDITVADVTEIRPSKMRNYILLKIKRFSDTAIMV
jgi:putative methanogenesis marker protein 7